MKAKRIVCLAAAAIFYSTLAPAQYDTVQQDDESSAASGMETRKISKGVSVLLPQGARMHRRNASTYVEESSDEYAARNFARINNQLRSLEEENKVLAEEIKYIKSKLIMSEKARDKDAPKPSGE